MFHLIYSDNPADMDRADNLLDVGDTKKSINFVQFSKTDEKFKNEQN